MYTLGLYVHLLNSCLSKATWVCVPVSPSVLCLKLLEYRQPPTLEPLLHSETKVRLTKSQKEKSTTPMYISMFHMDAPLSSDRT